jgi:hypothetical protein
MRKFSFPFTSLQNSIWVDSMRIPQISSHIRLGITTWQRRIECLKFFSLNGFITLKHGFILHTFHPKAIVLKENNARLSMTQKIIVEEVAGLKFSLAPI